MTARLGLLLLAVPTMAAMGLVAGLLLLSPAPAAETAACPGVPVHLVLVTTNKSARHLLDGGAPENNSKMGFFACSCSYSRQGHPERPVSYAATDGWTSAVYACPALRRTFSLLVPNNSIWSRAPVAVAVANASEILGQLLPAPLAPPWLSFAAKPGTWEALRTWEAHGGALGGNRSA